MSSTALTRFNFGTIAVAKDVAVPDYLKEHAGTGQEQMDRDDIIIPRLGLAQAGNSPQLKRTSELYIEDLREGEFFNTVTNEIYGECVYVVPILFFKNYIKFKPMNDGGGVLAMYDDARDVPPDELKFVNGQKPVTTEFKNRLCLMCAEGRKPELIVVSFKSSGLKEAKKWNSLIKGTNLPAYARSYKLTPKVKQDGQKSWYIITVEPDVFVPQDFFNGAQKYFADLSKGGFKVDTSGLDNTDEGDGTEDQSTERGGTDF